MAVVRQPGFGAGELAPVLQGRTDLPRYESGLRKAFNVFPSKHGALFTRPGTEYRGKACGSISYVGTKANAQSDPSHVTYVPGDSQDPTTLHTVTGAVITGAKVRLIPFLFSDTSTSQNYVLEFGDCSLQVWKNGTLFVTDANIGGVALPYVAADLPKLKFVQSGNTVFLACPGYPPASVVRASDETFSYNVLDFARAQPTGGGNYLVDNPRVMVGEGGWSDATHSPVPRSFVVTQVTKDARGVVTESAPVKANLFHWFGDEYSPIFDYQAGAVIKMVDGHNGYSGTTGYRVALTNLNAPAYPSSNLELIETWDSGTHFNTGDVVQWIDANSNVAFYRALSNNNGQQPDLSPSVWSNLAGSYQIDAWNADKKIVAAPDRLLPIWLPCTTGTGSDPNFITFNIYAGVANAYGWIGSMSGSDIASNSTFYYDGTTPDLTTSPPMGLNPFQTDTSKTWTEEYPDAVCFFQDRLTFGGTPTRWATIFASSVSDYENFDQHLVPTTADSVIFGLSARKYDLIRELVGTDRLFALTDGGVWVVGGAGDTPFSPDSIDAHNYSDIGIDWVRALVVGGNILYVRNKGTGVRAIAYDWQRGGFAGVDLSQQAEHLILGHKIVDWAYAEDPWGLVWAVRDDGVLLTLTQGADEPNLWGWAQHQLAASALQPLSVCSIPEGDEDVLYVAVNGPPYTANAGAWSGSSTYSGPTDPVCATVTYSGFIFASLVSSNHNNQPNSDGTANAYWAPVSGNASAWMLRFSTRLEVGTGTGATKTPVALDYYVETDGAFNVTGGNLPVGGTMLAMWTHDETSGTVVGDSTGKYPLTAGLTTSIVAGKIGNARSFTGFGSAAGHTDFDWGPVDAAFADAVAGGDCTVLALINPADVLGADPVRTIFSLDTGDGTAYPVVVQLIRYDATGCFLSVQLGPSAYSDPNTTLIPFGAYSAVGYRWTGTTLDFFINGVKVGTQNSTVRPAAGTTSPRVLLGCQPYFFDRYAGIIDTVAVFGSALSDDEMATDYDQWEGLPAATSAIAPFNDGTELCAVYNNGTANSAPDFFPNLLVTDGQVTLPLPTRAATKVWIGLPYTWQVDLLDLGEARTRRKVVTEVAAEFKNDSTLAIGTRIKVGPDLNHLADSELISASSNLLRLGLPGRWGSSGRAALQGSNPIPVAFVAVNRKVDAGEE